MKPYIAVIGALALSACVSPEQAAVNRADFMTKVFPDPVDRHGIHLVYPMKRSLLVSYYPSEISEWDVMHRLSGFCMRDGRGTQAVRDDKPMTKDVAQLGNGRTAEVYRFTARCV